MPKVRARLLPGALELYGSKGVEIAGAKLYGLHFDVRRDPYSVQGRVIERVNSGVYQWNEMSAEHLDMGMKCLFIYVKLELTGRRFFVNSVDGRGNFTEPLSTEIFPRL